MFMLIYIFEMRHHHTDNSWKNSESFFIFKKSSEYSVISHARAHTHTHTHTHTHIHKY